MRALIIALFARPIRWWPCLRAWRTKLYVGTGLLLSVLAYPIASTIWQFPIIVTLVWSPWPLVFGWLAGRLIGEAAIQRGEERAAEYLKRRGIKQ